jgi:serine/threonine protein kinase
MATVTNRTITSVKTRKKRQNHPLVFEKLPKCFRSRIRDMTSYRVNCGKNLLLGYNSIKSAEDPNDFVHVVKSKLENYNDPVVVKIYDSENEHLGIEIKILERINGYRNTAILICHFSCKDNKNNYFSKIIKPIRFCTNGSHSLHYFVYEYIATGDISTFFTKNTDKDVVKSFVLQLIAVIIELAVVYRIYHGDINSGNIMVDTTEDKTLDYCIETETVTIETYGIMPKMIDSCSFSTSFCLRISTTVCGGFCGVVCLHLDFLCLMSESLRVNLLPQLVQQKWWIFAAGVMVRIGGFWW